MFDIKEYGKQYRGNHREESKKYAKQWYKDNREKARAAMKRYRENHRKELCEMEKIRNRKRTPYIVIAQEKIGRELRDGEGVHHIDMNNKNNNPENLYIYENNSKHQKIHGSLNRLVAELLKNNIIEFKDDKYWIR